MIRTRRPLESLQPPAAPAERDELAIEVALKSTSELERIALPAPKMPAGPKGVGAT